MTVQNTTRFIRANGDGIVDTFQFSFPAKLVTDVTVKKIVNSTGTATTQTVDVDYTITLNTVTEGGTIIYTVPPTALEDSFITRETTQDQQTALPIGGNFPEISVENEIDRSRMIDIEIQEQIGRCIIISDTESLTGVNAPMGSSASDRALKVWSWDTTGTSLILGATIGNFQGDWVTATNYVVRDLIKDTTNNNIFFCNTTHTSTGALPIDTNADSAKWDLLVDAESASDSAAAAAVSETNAATSASNAATSETNAASSETNAATSASNAATSETNAASSETNAASSAAAAAVSAATIPTVFSTTADPTANSDAADTDGNGNFSTNSQWTNTTTNETFTCKDATATAAIWHGDQGVQGATIADSGTPDIFNNGDGETIHLAGTTTITDFPDAPRLGMWRKIIFDGARTLTHGSGITLQGGANITTAANDYAFVYADTVSAFEVLYFKADGTSVIGGGGGVVQTVNTQTGAVATGTTALPDDDTIPQITEGDEFMTLAITPTDTANKLKIDVVWIGAASVGDNFVVALFQDTTANALAAAMPRVFIADGVVVVSFSHFMTSGTTSSITFRVRAGFSGGSTTTFNGRVGGRSMGGAMPSSITVAELLP